MTPEQLKEYEYRWFYGIERLSIKDKMDLIDAWNEIIRFFKQ